MQGKPPEFVIQPAYSSQVSVDTTIYNSMAADTKHRDRIAYLTRRFDYKLKQSTAFALLLFF